MFFKIFDLKVDSMFFLFRILYFRLIGFVIMFVIGDLIFYGNVIMGFFNEFFIVEIILIVNDL